MEHKADKGLKGGSCNRGACQKPGAYWYNYSTQAYYCEDCAKKINYWSMKDDNAVLCSYKGGEDEPIPSIN